MERDVGYNIEGETPRTFTCCCAISLVSPIIFLFPPPLTLPSRLDGQSQRRIPRKNGVNVGREFSCHGKKLMKIFLARTIWRSVVRSNKFSLYPRVCALLHQLPDVSITLSAETVKVLITSIGIFHRTYAQEPRTRKTFLSLERP